MNNEMPINVPFESVYSVYTGKVHTCCCGCAGKHTYISSHRDFASKNRGYEVQDSEICDSAVKRIYNQIVNDPRAVVEDGYVMVETETRLKVAYFKNA